MESCFALFRYLPLPSIFFLISQQQQKTIFYKRLFWLYLLKRGTTWNELQQARNNPKQPEKTYNEQETNWNDLQQPRNDLKRPTTSKKQPEMTYDNLKQEKNDMKRPTVSKKRPETTFNKDVIIWKDLHRTEPSFMESIYSKNNHAEGSIVTKKQWIISVVEIFCIMCAYERKNKANVRTKRSKTLNNDLIS